MSRLARRLRWTNGSGHNGSQTSSLRNQLEPKGVSLIVYDVSPLGRPRVPQ
jgi:hypothetical protein